tara:strand:+ start:592 stop:948 length:357 start_codon:yes stop_codon:yes gene_type:complete
MNKDVINGALLELASMISAAKCSNCEQLNSEIDLIKKSISKLETEVLDIDIHRISTNNLSLRVGHIENMMFEEHISRMAKARNLLGRVFTKSTLSVVWLCLLTFAAGIGIVFLIQRFL